MNERVIAIKVQRAHSMTLAVCEDPRCRAIHFVGFDSGDKPMCDMLVEIADVPDLIEHIRELARDIEAKGTCIRTQ